MKCVASCRVDAPGVFGFFFFFLVAQAVEGAGVLQMLCLALQD